MSDENRKPGTARFTFTEPVIMSRSQLITPRRFKKGNQESGSPMFTAQFLFNPESADLKAIKALCAKVANEKWSGRLQREAAERKAGGNGAGHLLFPFSSGDKKADEAKAERRNREFMRGKVLLSTHSDEGHPPRLSGFENGVPVDYEGDAKKAAAGKFYAGVEVLAQINLVAYEGPKIGTVAIHGVTAYINMVFTTNKGKRLATAQSAAEVFSGYVGKVSQEDPTAGQFDAPAVEDDEIPF